MIILDPLRIIPSSIPGSSRYFQYLWGVETPKASRRRDAFGRRWVRGMVWGASWALQADLGRSPAEIEFSVFVTLKLICIPGQELSFFELEFARATRVLGTALVIAQYCCERLLTFPMLTEVFLTVKSFYLRVWFNMNTWSWIAGFVSELSVSLMAVVFVSSYTK